MTDVQTALIYTMVLASASDADMTDAELMRIGQIVSHLPIFTDFETDKLPEVARECAKLLEDEP